MSNGSSGVALTAAETAASASAASIPHARTRTPAAAITPLPRQLSDSELAMFSHAGPCRLVQSGETIFRKGELGRSMFVIESGEVRLEFGDGMPNKVIGAREFFGELALFIGNHTRVASAFAVGESELRVVEHAAFELLLQEHPILLAQFMRRSFAYLVASEQQLIGSLKRRNEDLMVTLDSLRQTQTQLTSANRLVRTDELTGMTNRRGLYHFLDALETHRAPDTQLALILIDLDAFKQINDRFGHLVGDQVLCAVAREVGNNAAACDLSCRLGGDEFALLVQIAHSDDLQARAAQIVSSVRSLRFPSPCDTLNLTVSIGVSLCTDGGEWSMWYSDADSALYRAKGEGGDSWCLMPGG